MDYESDMALHTLAHRMVAEVLWMVGGTFSPATLRYYQNLVED